MAGSEAVQPCLGTSSARLPCAAAILPLLLWFSFQDSAFQVQWCQFDWHWILLSNSLCNIDMKFIFLSFSDKILCWLQLLSASHMLFSPSNRVWGFLNLMQRQRLILRSPFSMYQWKIPGKVWSRSDRTWKWAQNGDLLFTQTTEEYQTGSFQVVIRV